MPSRTTSSRSKCHLNLTAGRKAHWLRHQSGLRFIGKIHARPGAQIPYKIKEVPAKAGRDFQSKIASKEKLRSAALTVAVLVIFFSVVLTLTALFWLLLTGLATLLALSGLTALLALFLHIVCHEYPS